MIPLARRRDYIDPVFLFHYWRAMRRHARLIEQPCSEGNCVELFDPKTGKADDGWGPVGCPCQDDEATS